MLPKMHLAGTNLVVSRLCYGTNMFGTSIDQARADTLLDCFTAHGGNFLDTARCYGDWVPEAPSGASERTIGTWLKTRKRSDVVLGTKGGYIDVRSGSWSVRMSPEAIATDLSESLEHLGTDYIDLYWLHADDPTQPLEPVIDALINHQEAGQIRYFGASNWTPDRIRAANSYAQSIGHAGFAAIQPFWGLALPHREKAARSGYGPYYEDGFADLHADGLPVIPYAAQSGGYFTKRDQGEDAVPEPLRERYDMPANADRLAAARAVAQQHGVSINDVVLAYLLSQPNATIPIFGASTTRQIEESVQAVTLSLSLAELEKLAAQ